MDEGRFRALVHDAIGEAPDQPWLAGAVRTRLAAAPVRQARLRPPFLLAAALLLVTVLGAALLGPQLLAGRSRPVTPIVAAPQKSPTQVNPFNCRLPVSGPNNEVGFVDTSTGQFTRDFSPVLGWPGQYGPGTPRAYSAAAHAWLTVSPSQVSPDGRSIAWTEGMQLHRFDLTAGAVVTTLWTTSEDIFVWRWDAAGIHVADQPFQPMRPGTVDTWLIDPVSGAVIKQSILLNRWPFTPLSGDPTGVNGSGFHPLGTDSEGRTIWWFFNLDRPGAVDWVFYETEPGQRVYIYKGVQGDAIGFDPDQAFGDASGVWFTDHLHRAIWHWALGGTLQKVTQLAPTGWSPVAILGPCA